MNQIPETRISLILRLSDSSDEAAWNEFVDLYEPFVYRFGRYQGLQDCDALELVQEVFSGVASSIGNWQPNPDKARFRSWLFRIAKNQLLKLLKERRKRALDHDTGQWESLDKENLELDKSGEQEAVYRKLLLARAVSVVEGDFQPETWEAFRLSTLENLSISETAARLNVSQDQVYVARSRVVKKLKAKIAIFALEIE